MGIFDGFFKSDKVIKKATDGVYQGLDKAILTDEEKLDYKNINNEFFLKGAELKIKMLEHFTPYRLMQRFIALITFIPYMFFFCVATYMRIQGNNETADLIFKDLKELMPLVMMIGAFYYSGSVLSYFKKS